MAGHGLDVGRNCTTSVPTIRRFEVITGTERRRRWSEDEKAEIVAESQSARLNGHDPFVYLRDVLERIVSGETKANQLDILLPWNWRPTGKAAVAQAA